jgi:hypothetical protein
MTFLTKALPLYVNLILSVSLILVFTGTWLIINDLSRLLKGMTGKREEPILRTFYFKIRMRRIVAIFAGIGLIVLYLLERNMTVFVAIIIGLYFFDSIRITAAARGLVESIYEKYGNTKTLEKSK